MGKIVVSTNMSLDGISQDPTGEEGYPFGGWFLKISAADREAWAEVETQEALAAEAMLLGGRSYEWFAQRWVGRPGVWGERLESLPKFVVRSTPGRTDWGPTTDLSGDVIDEVAKLRQNIAGEIVVYASYELVHALLEHDLVDTLRLIVFPRVVGAGGRLFRELSDGRSVRLRSAGTLGAGLVQVTYDVVHAGEGDNE